MDRVGRLGGEVVGTEAFGSEDMVDNEGASGPEV